MTTGSNQTTTPRCNRYSEPPDPLLGQISRIAAIHLPHPPPGSPQIRHQLSDHTAMVGLRRRIAP